MAKDDRDRFDDCIAYIRQNIDDALATHLDATVVQKDQIGAELTLGKRWDGLARSKNKKVKTEQRRALRALLLCQRVCYSELWPCLIGNVATRTAHSWLPGNWKEQSCEFWAAKSETEIREAIEAFVATQGNPVRVAQIARSGAPEWLNLPMLTAARATWTGQRANTCYDAVMLWLFLSGLVSLRWLLKHKNANTQTTLEAAFGRGNGIWNGPFHAADRLPPVPRGHIVHIYQHDVAWRGHWMVSNGSGKACGCNNNDENPPVPRDYCNRLTLDKQMLDFGRGTAVVINPRQIPERS